MSFIEKISSLFSLSTPVLDNDVERLLSDQNLRKKLLEDIDKEREDYTSSNKKNFPNEEIKRVGNFEFNL